MTPIDPADVRELLRLDAGYIASGGVAVGDRLPRLEHYLAVPLARLCVAAGKAMKHDSECVGCGAKLRFGHTHKKPDCWAAALVKLAEGT